MLKALVVLIVTLLRRQSWTVRAAQPGCATENPDPEAAERQVEDPEDPPVLEPKAKNLVPVHHTLLLFAHLRRLFLDIT